MEPEFWHQRWQENLIGFHQSEVNPYLKKYVSSLGVAPGDTVFVPLCGKSLDMWWLQQQGFRVIGVELSPIASEAFFTDSGHHPHQLESASFTIWKSADVEILCGDFFDLTEDMLTNVRAVFDRAALIALPPALRRKYVDHLGRILPKDANGLLVTMEYPQSDMQGPPFSVAQAEVESLFAEHFNVELLEDIDVLAGNPRFRDRGLSMMHEKIYQYRRR
jgi:thiopurine S-methyltransferase